MGLGAIGEAQRKTLELSLRLLATFGAMAAALMLLQLTTDISIPRLPFAVLAGLVVSRRRRPSPKARRTAAMALGVAAAAVFVQEAVTFGTAEGGMPSVALVVFLVMTGAVVGALAWAGMTLRPASR